MPAKYTFTVDGTRYTSATRAYRATAAACRAGRKDYRVRVNGEPITLDALASEAAAERRERASNARQFK